MKNMDRILVIGCVFALLSTVLGFDNVCAEVEVRLITRPSNAQNIPIRPDPKPIAIMAQITEENQNLQYEWLLEEGQGELKGAEKKSAIVMYVPPTEGAPTEVTITVNVKDEATTIASENITFNLLAPTPTPTPTPTSTPTPTPTPTPIPLRIIDVPLKDLENIPVEPIYELASGASVIIEAEFTGPSDHEIIVEYSAVFGTFESRKQGWEMYTVPEMPGGQDIITVKVLDKTAETVRTRSIIISILETHTQ